MLTLNPAVVHVEAPETRGLLDMARAGDAEAFGEICRLYETRLLRHAMTLCDNPTLAEDLAQDTLVEAWKCLRRFNNRCQFFTWLCAILLNRYRNTLRRSRSQPCSAFGEFTGDQFQTAIGNKSDGAALPDEQAQLRDQAALVMACMQVLPAKHQRVIYLRFYVDNSLEGIASALGCSVGTVKSRLFHGLEKLRAMKQLTGEFSNLKTDVSTL